MDLKVFLHKAAEHGCLNLTKNLTSLTGGYESWIPLFFYFLWKKIELIEDFIVQKTKRVISFQKNLSNVDCLRLFFDILSISV